MMEASVQGRVQNDASMSSWTETTIYNTRKNMIDDPCNEEELTMALLWCYNWERKYNAENNVGQIDF